MMMREGLRMVLELEKDIQIIGEAEDGRQAVALVKKLRPAVALMARYAIAEGIIESNDRRIIG